MKLIKEKKKKFYKENIGKPKKFWKVLKLLGFPCKKKFNFEHFPKKG